MDMYDWEQKIKEQEQKIRQRYAELETEISYRNANQIKLASHIYAAVCDEYSELIQYGKRFGWCQGGKQ